MFVGWLFACAPGKNGRWNRSLRWSMIIICESQVMYTDMAKGQRVSESASQPRISCNIQQR